MQHNFFRLSLYHSPSCKGPFFALLRFSSKCLMEAAPRITASENMKKVSLSVAYMIGARMGKGEGELGTRTGEWGRGKSFNRLATGTSFPLSLASLAPGVHLLPLLPYPVQRLPHRLHCLLLSHLCVIDQVSLSQWVGSVTWFNFYCI